MSSMDETRFIRCTWKRPQGLPERRGGPGPNGSCTYQESAPMRALHRRIFAAGAKARRPCRPHAVAGLAEILPQPPVTRNQVELMQIDTVASENRPGLRALGISPRSLEEELEAMLKHGKTQTQRTLTPGRG